MEVHPTNGKWLESCSSNNDDHNNDHNNAQPHFPLEIKTEASNTGINSHMYSFRSHYQATLTFIINDLHVNGATVGVMRASCGDIKTVNNS